MSSSNSNHQDVFVKGRNWGDLKLSSNQISLTGDEKPWFNIPFSSISNVQQASNKNEIALEFNIDEEGDKNDFLLCEMRLYVPDKTEKKDSESNDENKSEEKENKTSAELLKDEITKAANIGTVSDSIAHVPEIQMITPRGKFDLYFMKSFIKIHGQTHNYKILHKNIAKVFLVPKIDGHHHFLIVSLVNPINQGNTSYPFLIFQIKDDVESTVELNIPEGMKLELPNPLEGTTKDNIAQLFNAIVNIGIIIPSKNFTFSKGAFLKCSYKANEGVLYPLEKSLLFVHKPVLCINHEDIRQVDCARVHDTNLQQRTFDMNIVTKKDEIQFVGLEKSELEPILNYFSGKKIKVNNIDEKNNIVDIGPTTSSTRRTRVPVTDVPMELPSDESLVGDDDYSSEEDDEDDEEEDEDANMSSDDDKKKKKSHKEHKSKKDKKRKSSD